MEDVLNTEVKEKKKLETPLKVILLYFLGYMIIGTFIIGMISGAISTISLMSTYGLDGLLELMVDVDNFIFLIMDSIILPMLITQVIVEAILLVIFILVSKDILSFEKIKDKKIGKMILLTLGISVIFILGNMVLGFLIDLIPGTSESTNQQAIIDLILEYPLPILFSTVIFAPIVEEIVFRGGIFNFVNMKRKKEYDESGNEKENDLYAILISGAIFGVLHVAAGLSSGNFFELIYFIQYFAMGCAFGFIYSKTKNIYMCMGVHLINNLLSVLLIMFLY